MAEARGIRLTHFDEKTLSLYNIIDPFIGAHVESFQSSQNHIIRFIEQAFYRYYPAIFRFFCYRGADAEVANDLAASVFGRALAHLKQSNPRRAHVQTWLFTIGRNLSINHWKSEKGIPPLPLYLRN